MKWSFIKKYNWKLKVNFENKIREIIKKFKSLGVKVKETVIKRCLKS